MSRYDTIVIGAGIAGLTTAGQLAQAGQKVLVIANGIGALLLASGCIDVLGFQPADSSQAVTNPTKALSDFMAARPDHPYNVIGPKNIEAGLQAFQHMVNSAGLDYQGDFTRNWLLPSTIGAIHPTCLAPAALAQGDLSNRKSMLIVGFSELRDFYPTLISQNLNEQNLGFKVEPLILEVSIPLAKLANATPIEVAHAFEQPEFRQAVVNLIKDKSANFDRVGFPAVLGLNQHREVVADLKKQLGKPVFEISALPPSVPGRRLFEALKRVLLQAGGRLLIGSKVVDGVIAGGRVTEIRHETASRLKPLTAQNYVLATGGIFGGGLEPHHNGQIEETIFGLPVKFDQNRHTWFEQTFISAHGQPVFNFGLKVNSQLKPVNGSQEPLAQNLYVVGAALAGAEWTSSRTGDGLALATAAAAVRQILAK
jgi:glycerol-3-phosphate dehydrogenase subunit B